MARYATPLTDKQIKNAKPQDKKKLFDGGGLYIEIATNSKLWRFRYKHPITKKETTASFGKYPLVSLLHARKMRAEAQALINQGIDPIEQKKEQKAEQLRAINNTFEKVTLSLYEQKKIKGLKAQTIKEKLAFFKNNIFEHLGHLPIDKINSSIAISVLNKLKDKGLNKSAVIGAGRVKEVVDHAVNMGLIPYNPISNIKKAFVAPITKHHKTLKAPEFTEFMKALNKPYDYNLIALNAFKFLILTMTRRNETLKATWDEIDIDNQVWIIPAERMKKRAEHKIPLSRQALDILKQMKAINNGSPFVFFSTKNNVSISQNLFTNIINKAGFADKVVPHGFRAVASTILNEHNFRYDIIETALSHTDKNIVRRTYNNAEYEQQKKDLFNWWGDYVEKQSQ